MKRLLLIEDNTLTRENFCEIFESGGYEVIAASNGETGIELAKSSNPNLIICDLMMPNMDGFEVKKILSKNKKTSSIPFIYLTALADIKDVQYAMELGADDYITKPVGAKKLLELISNRLLRIEELNKKDSEKLPQNIYKTEDENILIKSGGKHILAVLDDIIIIKAKKDYSEILLKTGEKALIKKTLKSWEKTLPEKTFLRIHRNTIINSKLIEKIEPMFNGSYVARLKYYPDPIYFSQRYSQKIRKKLLLK